MLEKYLLSISDRAFSLLLDIVRARGGDVRKLDTCLIADLLKALMLEKMDGIVEDVREIGEAGVPHGHALAALRFAAAADICGELLRRYETRGGGW